MLLSSALALAACTSAHAQTMVEQVGVTQISNTLNQVSTPNLKAPNIPAPAVISPAQPAATDASSPASLLTLPVSAPTPAYLAALDKAQASLKAGSYRDAQAQYEALVSQDYQNPQAHFGLGLSLFALSDLQGARFEFTQLAALNPAGFEGPYNLGVVASRLNDNAEALTQFTKAAELARGKVSTPVLRQVLEALAGEQARKADYAALVTTLSEMVRAEPTDLDLQYRQAQALTLAGQGTLALPVLYALRQKAPGNTDAALLTADIYAAQKLTDRAIRELDAAVPPAPDGTARARLLLRKADLLATSGRTRDAVFAAQDAVNADSRNAAAQARLGELRYARNDRPGALTAWKAAVALDPKNALYLASQAVVELALGQNAQAAQDARRASLLPGDNAALARAQFVQGVASYRQADYASARSALASSALKAPSAETSLWLGLSSYALKDYGGAVLALQDSLKLQPSAQTQLSLGSALIASGRYADAEATLRPLVVSDPTNGEAWYQLGLSRQAQGRKAEALASFRTAASLGNARARSALK
ncbi:tetratricopeptide repeat protein [Deinococcus aquiradiocola]|uniref:tetratricopeptide repeat protein n=1 Tax=Deinococcus aquiradiocola TaxID=393059 RepID=UPI00227A3C73|nr:tetratricopeptide repeat protein [Deinococcus aquiradiocola]